MVTGVNAGVNNAYTLGSLTPSTPTGAARTVDMGMINMLNNSSNQPNDVSGKLPGTASDYFEILDNMQQDKKKPGLWQSLVNMGTRHAINSRASR